MNANASSDDDGADAGSPATLWGPQTELARHHFAVSTERMPEGLLRALALLKRVCAQVNAESGALDHAVSVAIQQACNEVLSGQHDDAFPLAVWQSGSGTQTNMNMNEVLARLASAHLPRNHTPWRQVHPNDDVNRSQSTNDIFPSALQVSAAMAVTHDLLPALRKLRSAIQAVAEKGRGIEKVGRTHLQDAVMMTVEQEWMAFDAQIEQATQSIERAREPVLALPVGGTAVGTGINAPDGFGQRVCQSMSHLLGLPFVEAENKFAAIAAHDSLVGLHGALKQLAVALMKLANDTRWLGSGPRCGLGELILPANEPGSSIMLGKVNPTQCEMLSMVCVQVMANDVGMGWCGASGNLQLNTFKPLMAHTLLQSLRLLAGSVTSFARFGLQDLRISEERLAWYRGRSLMGITALTPEIGYDRAARIARKACDDDLSLADAARTLGEDAALVQRLQGDSASSGSA